MLFQDVPARPDYLALEQRVQQLWETERVFERLRQQNAGGPRWSFLDGPITANGAMGVHHAWGRTLKDLYNRYHALRGCELRWQQGFDCQGLWVEVQVEKELGFRDKRQIESYGVDAFVRRCKERVARYAELITRQSQRLGYWMDWDSSYYTLSDENNYSIWAFLKRCHERGWLYRGRDVLPWCPRCGTALSEHEIATEGYAERTHLALTVALPLPDRPGEALAVWTTTPWTLPANVAAAVHPEQVYVRLERRSDEGRRTDQRQNPDPRLGSEDEGGGPFEMASVWVAKGALERLRAAAGLDPAAWRAAEERAGAELVGWRYTGPFDGLEAQRGVAHRVVAWREVSETEGTGAVHLAPGAGREDFQHGQAGGLAVLAPLDDQGVYLPGYGWLSGRPAAEVPEAVAGDLERRGLLLARERYTHRYPVCWRCGTDLVFRLVDEWLIRMDELRPAMMEAARSAVWLPSFGLERELDWLRNMGDWMISKKRYWGLALPIYPCTACGHVTVVGSREELRRRAVAGWDEFEGQSPHRPWVDAVRVACAACGAAAARVPDVGNPWLDAGIVAFSTLGYHRDPEEWARWFPADLVLESFPGQFRNWFYALLAMSTTLEGRAPFKTLLGYATVKDADGAEMHKSRGNAIPFEQAADWLGVEPLRWLFASAALERNLHFGPALVEEAARRLQPLWEVYRFFVTYASLEAEDLELAAHLRWRDGAAPASRLDAWLLARLEALVEQGQARLDAYDARGFALEVEAFLDDLSTWYVRRARRRFWGARAEGTASPADRREAFATLYTALVTLARLLAPVLPFLSEALYQNLVRSLDPSAPASVHLAGFPQADQRPTTNDEGDEGRTTKDEAGGEGRATNDHEQWPWNEGQRAKDGGDGTAERAHPLTPSPPHPSTPLPSHLLAEVDLVRRVVALGRAARRQAGLRVRQPLARMLVVAGPREGAALERHREDLLEELNVKALELLDSAGGLLRHRLRPNLRLLGPRLGRMLPALRVALERLTPAQAAGLVADAAAGRPVELVLDGQPLCLTLDELLVETSPLEGYAVAREGHLQVALDTALTEELRREGAARDLVRAVQEARKQAGLAVSERIVLYLPVQSELDVLLAAWGVYLRAETLCARLVRAAPPDHAYTAQIELDGVPLTLGVAPEGWRP